MTAPDSVIDHVAAPVLAPRAYARALGADHATVLFTAAELIRDRGWCQGYYRLPDGRLCPEGAIREACKIQRRPDLELAIVDALDRRLGGMLPVWNDQSERTADQVLDVLDGLAAAARDGAS